MDRLLRQVSSRSWLFLSPTRSFSSLKQNYVEFKPHVLVNLRPQYNSAIDFTYEHHPRFPLPGQIGVVKSILREEKRKNECRGKFINEMHAYDCSVALRSDLRNLFANYDTLSQPLTAITVVFRTKSDMSTWSTEVEEERNELIGKFNKFAREVSEYLKSNDYWVDFIDPSTGKPYYASNTSDVLWETDERFRHLGIEIVDLGCCRVIEHLQYGQLFFSLSLSYRKEMIYSLSRNSRIHWLYLYKCLEIRQSCSTTSSRLQCSFLLI